MKKIIKFILIALIASAFFNCFNFHKDYDKILDEFEVIMHELGQAYAEKDIGKFTKAQQKLDEFSEKYDGIDETEMTAEQINRSIKILKEVFEKYGLDSMDNKQQLFK